MAEKKPVVLRVKRRREDSFTDDAIALEAGQGHLPTAAQLIDSLSRFGIRAGESDAGLKVSTIDGPPDPSVRRKVFRLLPNVSGSTRKDFSIPMPEVFDTLEREAASSLKRGRDDTQSCAGASGAETAVNPISTCVGQYEMAPKRARFMRQNDKVQDSLLDTCYIYDVHKIYPSSEEASDVEAASVGQAGYVYDLYCLDETEPGAETETIPTLKVEKFEEEWLWDGDDVQSSFDSQDSNNEEHYANDYPDEDDYISENSADYDPDLAGSDSCEY